MTQATLSNPTLSNPTLSNPTLSNPTITDTTRQTGETEHYARDRQAHDWRTEEAVMRWYGWGSPIGFSIALVGFGAAALLLRHAILGG
jgi:hypothetical protein